MLSVVKLCTLMATVLVGLLAVTAVPSVTIESNYTNVSNKSSILDSKGFPSSGGSSPGTCTCNCPSTAASTASSGCFASDTLITLANRKHIPIEQLRSGDELLTADGSRIVTTQMMMMLDKNRFSQALFHTFVTASGHNVSLTEQHLIPTIQDNNTIQYVPAKQVKIGDVLYVMSDGGLIPSPVINVVLEMKTGYYAPLTTDGTLLVNGVMASCFANVRSHDAAQFYMGPLRMYHWLARSLFINKPFGHQEIDGMHFIPEMMYEFGRFFRPSTLRLT